VKNKNERIGRMLEMHANDRTEIKNAAGAIIAIVGLKDTTTGETLCDKNDAVILEKMDFPEPVIKVAVEPKTKNDQQKMSEALLVCLAAEDSFRYMYTSRYGSMDVWPNAAIANFQEQEEGQLTIANGIALSFNPIIRNEEMPRGWEAHATETAFILGSDKLLTRDEDCAGCRIVEDGIFRKVDGDIVYDPGLSPGSVFATYLVPVWQISHLNKLQSCHV
jgi:hypothetical protein